MMDGDCVCVRERRRGLYLCVCEMDKGERDCGRELNAADRMRLMKLRPVEQEGGKRSRRVRLS